MKDFPPGTRLRRDDGGVLRVVRKTLYAWYIVTSYDKGGAFMYRGIVPYGYLLSLQELRCPLREEEEGG